MSYTAGPVGGANRQCQGHNSASPAVASDAGHRKLLVITTSVCACACFAFLCIAVSTDYWLHAKERVHFNNNTAIYMTTFTGLWRKCVLDVRIKNTLNCSYVNYFQDTDRDGLGPTDAILLSMQRSTVFPLISLLILLLAQIFCFLGHCNNRRNLYTFLSGILFVVGGLVTLIGIILFIGAITEEVGNKTKGGSTAGNAEDGPQFSYSYGSSFILTVSSFIVSELTGVLSVYLYISRYKHAYRKKQARVVRETNERSLQRVGSRRSSRRSSYAEHSPIGSDAYFVYTPAHATPSHATLPAHSGSARTTHATHATTHATTETTMATSASAYVFPASTSRYDAADTDWSNQHPPPPPPPPDTPLGMPGVSGTQSTTFTDWSVDSFSRRTTNV